MITLLKENEDGVDPFILYNEHEHITMRCFDLGYSATSHVEDEALDIRINIEDLTKNRRNKILEAILN